MTPCSCYGRNNTGTGELVPLEVLRGELELLDGGGMGTGGRQEVWARVQALALM